jgi:uncharacterized RDD family membrane protein YckC
MSSQIQFETPENVQISYQPGGLGTRFIAWLLDVVIVLVLFAICACAGLFLLGTYLADFGPEGDEPLLVMAYYLAATHMAFGLVCMGYFTLCELFMRGQSIGKRSLNVRVVKVSGFSLDPISIFVRNIFRIVDQLPWLWIVPALSKRSQRFGDMVAGTVVVGDAPQKILRVREELSSRTALDARYRFEHAALARLRPVDLTAVEQLLDRWDHLSDRQRQWLLDKMIDPLAARLKVDAPPVEDRLRFLEDLMATEYRRQSRNLG